MTRSGRTGNVVLVLAVAMLCGSSVLAWGPGARPAKPQDVTLTGKLVDLQSFMTEKFASTDKVKCTRECVLAGIPAALETKDGIVVIGAGAKGEHKAQLLPLAYQDVEIKGKLHEKHGLKYIELATIKSAKPVPTPALRGKTVDPDEDEDEDEDEGDEDEEE